MEVFFPTGVVTGLSHLILEQYLKENDCTYIFTYHQNRNFLSIGCQKELFKRVTNFIENTYTLKAKEDEIVAVCLAVVKLFPSLEIKPSSVGGIVSSFINECKSYILNFNSSFHIGYAV